MHIQTAIDHDSLVHQLDPIIADCRRAARYAYNNGDKSASRELKTREKELAAVRYLILSALERHQAAERQGATAHV